MTVKLNQTALRHARSLVRDGKVVRDERDDWSEHAPSADDENRETKGHYSFPYGDFRKVHRCGVISLESRAGQFDHDDIRDESKKLLELIDED